MGKGAPMSFARAVCGVVNLLRSKRGYGDVYTCTDFANILYVGNTFLGRVDTQIGYWTEIQLGVSPEWKGGATRRRAQIVSDRA